MSNTGVIAIAYLDLGDEIRKIYRINSKRMLAPPHLFVQFENWL